MAYLLERPRFFHLMLGSCGSCGYFFEKSQTYNSCLVQTDCIDGRFDSGLVKPVPGIFLCRDCSKHAPEFREKFAGTQKNLFDSVLTTFRKFVIIRNLMDPIATDAHLLRLLTYNHDRQRLGYQYIEDRLATRPGNETVADLRELYHHRHCRGYMNDMGTWVPVMLPPKPIKHMEIVRELHAARYQATGQYTTLRAQVERVVQAMTETLGAVISDGDTLTLDQLGTWKGYEIRNNTFAGEGTTIKAQRFSGAPELIEDMKHEMPVWGLPWTWAIPKPWTIQDGGLLADHGIEHDATARELPYMRRCWEIDGEPSVKHVPVKAMTSMVQDPTPPELEACQLGEDFLEYLPQFGALKV